MNRPADVAGAVRKRASSRRQYCLMHDCGRAMLYLKSRLSNNSAMTACFRPRAASTRCLFLPLALLATTIGAGANAPDLVDQGQRAYQTGAFSQAAAYWQTALESFRSQGDTNAEIQTSLSLASACQSIGQQRRAVQILEDALVRAEKAGNRVNLVKSKLGTRRFSVE
jgi:tetratricopeptide (TPR) repeat protein